VALVVTLVLAQRVFAQVTNLRPPLGALVDVGQRKMHLHCVGSGNPTVVLESGASSFALDWALVQTDVGRTTRVCAYDRSGYGWIDPATAGEAPEQVVRDLSLPIMPSTGLFASWIFPKKARSECVDFLRPVRSDVGLLPRVGVTSHRGTPSLRHWTNVFNIAKRSN
jgi:pimeloyl-ACP methyl ester carboxylesterase